MSKIVQYGKGLDFQYGVVQINCLEKHFGNIPTIGITSGSQCKIIDKGFTLEYEQETKHWYKQKTLASGELLSPQTLNFLSTDWTLVTSTDTQNYIAGLTLYKLTLAHTLNTTLFNGYVYDSNNELMVTDLSAVDANRIKIISDENFNGKVVLI